MCEYCDQLTHVLTPSPVTACPACTKPLSDTDTPHTCSRCVLYALIHQNTFAQRWSDIQTSHTPIRPQQIHASLNTPQPVKHITPPSDKGKPRVNVLPNTTAVIRTRPNIHLNLALTQHTLQAIQQVLTATPATRTCTTTHISHPPLTLTMTHLHKLHSLINSIQDQTLSQRLIFHHLRITAMSTLLPSDRTLTITIDNNLHLLTPPRTGSVATPHHLHLFLNPHDRPPISSIHVLGTT